MAMVLPTKPTGFNEILLSTEARNGTTAGTLGLMSRARFCHTSTPIAAPSLNVLCPRAHARKHAHCCVQVDGAMLLELDDHQLRYELDMGAVIVRETLLRIIDGLKEKQRKVKANAVQASALRAKSKKKNSAAAASEDDSDSDQSEPISSDDDDDSDDGDSGDHAGKRMNAPRSKREKEAAAAAKARARQSRDAKRKAEQQELELTMLVRVGASVSALSVVYSLLAQSLESWHHRSVKMSGPNEDMEFATSLGIWSFSSKGHYHNDNMYSKLVPESSGKSQREWACEIESGAPF